MPDVPGSTRDISAIYEERRKTRDAEISLYNQVEAAIRGELPEEYSAMFSPTDIKLQLRTLRAADDSLTKFLAEVPIMPHVDAMGKRVSDTSRNKAETVEKIAHGWHNGSAARGGVEFDGITFQLARHQVRFGDGCLLVHPDHERKMVFFEVKDPRCLYTPVGWHPWSMTPLDGALLVYEMTLGEVKRRFAYDSYGDTKTDVMQRLNNAYSRNMHGEADDSQIVKVGVYRSREAWMVVAMSEHDVTLMESQTGDKNHPGVCGVTSFKQFASDPLFLGQIGIEAALMKVLNQQIENTDRINKAPMFGPPLMNDTVRWGEYNVIDLGMLQGRQIQPYRMAPDSPNNLTQVMGSLLSLSQMFNYNPESNMGAGEANSGKALQQLQAGPRALVTNILWSPYKPAFPRAYDDCLEMELNLWPNERKTIRGKQGKQSFEIDYTPSAALQGFKGHIKIEEARSGGYNAFLEAVQKKDAGLIDVRSVLEKDPDVDNVEDVLRRIGADSTEKFIEAGFEALGGQDPLLAIRAASEVLRKINDGKTKAEAIQEVIEEGMLEPPTPPEVPGAEGLPPGMPPELAALLGGGGGLPELPPAGVL